MLVLTVLNLLLLIWDSKLVKHVFERFEALLMRVDLLLCIAPHLPF